VRNPSLTRRSLAAACALAALAWLGGCAHERAAKVASTAADAHSSPPPPGPFEGAEVVAIVEKLEGRAYEEWLSDGSVYVANVLSLGVVAPERFDTLLEVHVKGHPRIGGRPLLLGDAVTFVLPRNWRNRDLSFADLERLAFRE
jgi:hypothetical protein